jgi:hypothetical protein
MNCYEPEEEDEFASLLAILQFIFGVENTVATFTLILGFLQVFHKLIISCG